MQAMSKIDPMKVPDAVVPAKAQEPKGRQFGQVMKEQHQTEKRTPVEPDPQQNVRANPQRGDNDPKVERPADHPINDNQVVPEQVQVSTEDEISTEPKLQQTVVELMKVISDGETEELAGKPDELKELLDQLVNQLEQGDLKGEQVLAGVDLSNLMEQLQLLDQEGDTGSLEQLVGQLSQELEQQLSIGEDSSTQAGLAAAQAGTDDVPSRSSALVERLSQARKALQKAIDAVSVNQLAGKATTESTEVVTKEAQAQEALLNGETTEEIDPRFAGLLKPRTENGQQQGLRQQAQSADSVAKTPVSDEATTIKPVTEAASEQGTATEFSELFSQNLKKGFEPLIQQTQAQPVAAQSQNAGGRVIPQTAVVQLPSGQQVAESQIFDQVVTHISGSQNGESGRMVLRLQPAELGSLKLELMVEGDRVKANLQAQTTQVQEVIERNLPQLRNALAEQGLKIDQFQVNIDKGQQQGGQFEHLAQQQQGQNSSQQQGWSQETEVEEQIIPLAHLMQNGGEGISLRV